MELFIDHPITKNYILNLTDPRIHELSDTVRFILLFAFNLADSSFEKMVRYKLKVAPFTKEEFLVSEKDEEEFEADLKSHKKMSRIIEVLDEVIELPSLLPESLEKIKSLRGEYTKVLN